MTYSTSLEHVPSSILLIPAVATLAPIGWATDTVIQTPSLDTEFVDSLNSVQQSFAEWYPSFSKPETIRTDQVESVQPAQTAARPLLLYSGGADSLTSYIRYQSENPILIPIHGADIRTDNIDEWDTVRSKIGSFAHSQSVSVSPIRSNYKEMLDGYTTVQCSEEDIIGGWWGGIHHGMGGLALTAPLTYEKGAPEVIIGSTHTENYNHPWGSHPSIDNKISWAGSSAVHDGFELTRQDKIAVIANFIESQMPNLTIRSCFSDADGRNCSVCEKCCRTILGLEMNELDPNRHGYDVDGETFNRIKEDLLAGNWRIGADEEWFWETIQDDADLSVDFPHPEAEEFLRWLLEQDVGDLREVAERQSPRQMIGSHLKLHLPRPVFQVIKEANNQLPF